MTTLSKADGFTEAQRAEYWEKGFIVLRGLLAESETASLREECDRLLASDYVHPDNIRTPFRMNSGDHPERIDPVADISPRFAALAADERILGAVRQIFGDEPLLFKDKLIFKLPGVSGYTLHQDQAWWQLCPPDDILSVSVAIDGADATNGGIALYPGCHDRLLTPEGVMRNFSAEESAAFDRAGREVPETQAGDVVVFHSLTPHESGPNTSERPRRSLYLSYSAARSGDLHARYYAHYRERMANQEGTRAKFYR